MIQSIQLTDIEKKLIHKVASVQIDSLRLLYYNGHPEITDFLNEYGEAYDVREMDATLEINELMNTYCGIKLNPELILGTNPVFLNAARFILTHDNWIPVDLYPNARRNLSNKLLRAINIKKTTNLN